MNNTAIITSIQVSRLYSNRAQQGYMVFSLTQQKLWAYSNNLLRKLVRFFTIYEIKLFPLRSLYYARIAIKAGR